MTEQYYKMILSDAIAQFDAGLISSTALLYYYLKIKLAPGWKMTLHQRSVCKELGISKAAFYKGIQRLKDKGLIGWEAPNGLVVSFGQIRDSLDKSETLWTNQRLLDRLETPLDKMETSTLSKPSQSNGSGNSPDSYQIFINSLR